MSMDVFIACMKFATGAVLIVAALSFWKDRR